MTINDSISVTKNTDYVESAISLIESIRRDIESAVRDIARNEFSPSGVGRLGSLYRVFSNIPPDETSEAWSSLIMLCNVVSDEGHHSEAGALLSSCARQFPPPPFLEGRVQSELNRFSDANAQIEIELALHDGDHSRALRLTSTISDVARQDIQQATEKKIKVVKTTRSAAAAVGGVSLVAMMSLAIYGSFTAVEFFKSPPSISNVSEDFKNISLFTPDAGENISRRPSTPTSDLPSIGFISSAAQNVIDQAQTEFQKVVPKRDYITVDESSSSYTKLNEDYHRVESSLPRPSPNDSTKGSNVSPPAEASMEDCLLGFAALQVGPSLAKSLPSEQVAIAKLKDFAEVIKTACAKLDADPISLAIEAGSVDRGAAAALARVMME